jgi:hypothetical protein
VYAERALGQAKAAARYARELVPAEVKDASSKQRLTEAGAKAAKAFDEFASYLESNKDKAKGDWAIGEELYSALLREKELLPFGAAELREKGREQHALLSTEANRIATEIDGSGDWAKTCDRLNKIHAPTPEAMRDEYDEWTQRARSFLRDTELVTLPRHAARTLLRSVSAGRDAAGGGAEAARGELQRRHPDDGGPRGVSRPPLAPRHGEVEPVARPAHLRNGVLQ